LHHLKALGFLAFFLGKRLVNVCGHSVFASGILGLTRAGGKAGRDENGLPVRLFWA
jgi:hypothetical protein